MFDNWKLKNVTDSAEISICLWVYTLYNQDSVSLAVVRKCETVNVSLGKLGASVIATHISEWVACSKS